MLERIIEEYEGMLGMKRNDGKKEFVDIVVKYGMSGFVLYACKLGTQENVSVELPPNMAIGFNDEGITIFDTNY